MKVNISLYTCFLLVMCGHLHGQLEAYDYNCRFDGISEEWHKVVLPNEIFSKVKQDLSDIRFYGILSDGDTIESPYIIRQLTDEVRSKEISFKRLNTSSNDKGYYYTLEIPTVEAINQIKLDFKKQNFDWLVKLEGSQDQQDWFTITEDYRILSIKNDITAYQFTKLSFPNSKYRFFRLLLASNENPELTKVSVANYEIKKGDYRSYPTIVTKDKENKNKKQTEFDVELPMSVPVSHLSIEVKDDYDFYRPITIQYLVDSTNTEKGWKYNYRTLAFGVLNSMDENEFKFNSTILRRLKIIIHNHDNQVLTLDSIKVSGYVYELVARFTEPASYVMAYGNKKASKPDYDIGRFANKIPEILVELQLGTAQLIKEDKLSTENVLFKSKMWLWIIMAIVILILGWFSFRMLKNVEEQEGDKL